MSLIPALLIAVILLSLLIVADRLDLLERLRRRWRAELAELKGKEKRDAAKGVWTYFVGVIPVAFAKQVWSWRNAPDGSIQKLVWRTVVAAAIAAVAWLLLTKIDKWINRSPTAMPDYSKITEEDALET